MSTEEAARALGVKPATLYAYVSRGLLSRERSASGSTFDPREVARIARSARNPAGTRRPTSARGVGGDEPVFVTELTLIEGGHLYYRGLDAVELSRTRTFEDVATLLWTSRWPPDDERWSTPPKVASSVEAAVEHIGARVLPIERFTVAVVAAALSDDLRHDLSPAAIPVVGRGLLSALVDSLPRRRAKRSGDGAGRRPGRYPESLSERLWPRLSALPLTERRKSVLESALVLVADHEIAPSTLAVRVAAALRADPYAAVMTGLGPASGGWYAGSSGAPTEVEHLLEETLTGDPERAVGDRLRRTGMVPHGFGMPLYPDGDPRAAELLTRLPEIDGSSDRHAAVERVLRLGAERGFPSPNVDMGLGALAFCAEMIPGAGQAISTLGKVAGWLAHAMEEYTSPTRFRSRADYVGNRPDSAG